MICTGSLKDATRSVVMWSFAWQCLLRSAAGIAGYNRVLVTVRRVAALDVGQPVVEPELVP